MTSGGIPPELRERYAAAAERAAAEAPEIRPGDEIALKIPRLYPVFRTWLVQHRSQQGRGAA